MTKIPEQYHLGDIENLDVPELARRLEEMYRVLARAINTKPTAITERNSDGSSIDKGLAVGDINVNQTTDKVEMLTSYTDPSTVVWTKLS